MTIQTFDFEGVPVRDVLVGREPWFVGKDVCGILGIADHNQALSSIPDDERGGYNVPTLRGEQEMICVNEPGLYRLIFKSRKPEAERFKKWVFHEVLPAIRATGTYQAKTAADAKPIDETMFVIPASKYIEMLEFKISVLEEKARPKTKRAARPPLTDDDYAEIRRLAAEGKTGNEIARLTGRSSGSISMALRICPILPEGGAT